MTRIGKWLRLVALVFSFVVLLLLVTGVYSVIPGNLDIVVSGDVQLDLHVQDGVLRLRVPATIVNRGFYDIRDVVVQVDATDSSRTLVFQAQSNPFTIPAGFVFNEDVVVAVNLTDAFRVHGSYYLFHSGNLSMNVTVSCRYLLNLFGVVLRIPNLTMPWAAPLQDFAVNVTQVNLVPYGGGSAVNATLTVTHNGWLELNQTAVQSELYHTNGTLITSNQTTVDLVPGATQHAVLFPLTDAWRVYLSANNATLRVNCTLSPLGITISHSQLIGWIVPPSGGGSPGFPSKPMAAMSFSGDRAATANPNAAVQVRYGRILLGSSERRRLTEEARSGSTLSHGGDAR